MPGRVLIVGIDGGTLDIVNPLVQQGKLPSMRRIMSEGVSGPLTSVYPPITSPAWSSFLTGKNPGKHGVFDFKRRSERGLKEVPVNSSDIKTDTLWRLLTKAGKSSCFLNVPMTYPPEQLNGFMVSGIPCPGDRISAYPEELAGELKSLGYKIDTEKTYYQLDKSSFAEEVFETTRVQAKAAMHLLRKKPWDLFMVVFMGADWLSHFYWRYLDPEHPHYNPVEAAKYNSIPKFYELFDQILGQLIEAAGSHTMTFVVSDHGFGSLHRNVYVNSWLRDIDLLALKEQTSSRKFVPMVMQKTGITPEKLINFLMKYSPSIVKRNVPDSLFDDFNAFLSKSAITPFYNLEDVDWTRTKVYCAGHVGQMWINLRGVEPNGIVDPSEYDGVRELLIDKLRGLEDPATGRKVVTRTFKREEIYKGPYAADGPDVLFLMEDLRYVAWEGIKLDSSYFSDPDNLASGFHRMNGMLLVQGEQIAKGVKTAANLVDVVPSILHILDLPIPRDSDGRCLKEVFLADSELARREPRYSESVQRERTEFVWSPEDEKAVEERLRGLGYMA